MEDWRNNIIFIRIRAEIINFDNFNKLINSNNNFNVISKHQNCQEKTLTVE